MKRTTVFVVMLAATVISAGGSFAQRNYPDKLVRIVVPYAPGGSSDMMARALAHKLSQMWKQPVIVENKPGGTTTIGARFVAKAAPDGDTLLLAAPPFVITKHVYPSLDYDSAQDFAPISLVAFYPLVLVTNVKVPATSLGDLIALAKRNPGMTYSSPGTGTTPHLTGELIRQRFRLDIVHVPYKSGGDAVTDLIGGQTQFYFGPTTEIVSHVKAGRLKALTVLAPKRSGVLPEVPTASEGGINDLEVSSWPTVVAPLRTPRDIVEKISRDIAIVVPMPDFRNRFVTQGAELVGSSPDAVTKFLVAEHSKWGQVVQNAGVKLD